MVLKWGFLMPPCAIVIKKRLSLLDLWKINIDEYLAYCLALSNRSAKDGPGIGGAATGMRAFVFFTTFF